MVVNMGLRAVNYQVLTLHIITVKQHDRATAVDFLVYITDAVDTIITFVQTLSVQTLCAT